ncbi:MAG: hypothetical protein KDD67_15165 [Ignavibacteriae bacterium]|nr:hypothetical protein [Ignavibacteriota bacterium]MCB9217561.1 hypothetical protein [Ignavibacteria bacterium]
MIQGRGGRIFLSVLITLPVLYWLVLLVAPRAFDHLWFWFWFAKETPIPFWWLLLLPAGLLFLLLPTLLRKIPSSLLAITLLVLFGYITQWTFTLIEGRGIEPMSEKMTYPEIAHSFFASKAVGEINVSEMIRTYDQLIVVDSLPRFPFITKPPGHFLTYIATERLGRLMLGTPTATSDRLQQLANFASFLWPLLTFLALFPLYFLGRRFLSEEESRIMLLLYTLTPNIVLMTMHLDQCLLPSLFLSVVLLFLKSVEKESVVLTLLCGFLLGVASFFSFSMVTLFPLLGLWHGGAELLRAKRENNSWKTMLVVSLRPTLTPLTLTLVGFALFHIILLIGFDYNWVREYQVAQEAHGVWKIQEWDIIRTIWVGFLDLFEYAVWIGFPIALFALLRSGVTIKRLRKHSLRSGDAMILSLLFLLFLLSFFGKTVAETGRLWTFLLPLVLIVAVMGLRLFPKRFRSTLLILLILLQFLHTFFMRWLQDFA